MRHTFWANEYAAKISSKLLYKQEAGAFGNNIGKKAQKQRPKLGNMCIIYLLRIFALPPIQCKC